MNSVQTYLGVPKICDAIPSAPAAHVPESQQLSYIENWDALYPPGARQILPLNKI